MLSNCPKKLIQQEEAELDLEPMQCGRKPEFITAALALS